MTIKSDDVPGRSKAYESIIKGEIIRKVNIPESFNVLIREMKGLCLDVELLKDGKKVDLGGEKPTVRKAPSVSRGSHDGEDDAGMVIND